MSLGSNVDSNISTAHSQRKDRRHHLPLFRLWVQNLVHKSKTQVQNLAQFCFPRKDTEKLEQVQQRPLQLSGLEQLLCAERLRELDLVSLETGPLGI